MALQAGSKGVNPKDLTPLSNRVKDFGDMDAYLTKEEAARTYLTLLQSEEFLTKLVAQATYQTIANMANYQEKLVDGQNLKRINGEGLLGSGNINVLTQAIADGIYQTISGMSDYVKWSDLPDIPSLQNYVQKTEAPGYADILTKTLASSIYQTVSGMVNYITKTEAPGYDDILTETLASTTYQTISAMSSYYTKTEIEQLYTPLTNNVVSSAKLQALANDTRNIMAVNASTTDFLRLSEDVSTNNPSLNVGGFLYDNNGDATFFSNSVHFSDDFEILSAEGQTPRRIGIKKSASGVFSFVGMVVQGTNLTTEASVKALYGSDTSWQLISSVALASEHVVGNGNVLGLTDGTEQGFISGVGNRDMYNLRSTLPQPLGTVGGSQYLGSNGFGVVTKTQASNDLSASGLIADTITVYSWERTA